MDNLAIKSILILMFVLIISKMLDGAYSTMIIILGIGMVSALVVEYVKKGGEIISEDAISDEEGKCFKYIFL